MMFSEDAPMAKTAGAESEELPMDLHALYEESFKNLKEGGVVEGTIVAIQQAGVVVDIGYKSEGLIPASEFSNAEIAALKVGELIQVYLEEREDSEGNLILSKEKAAKMKVWEVLEKSFENGEVVEGKMVSKVKGGMMVDIGVKAFLPGSQVDIRPVRDIGPLMHQPMQPMAPLRASGSLATTSSMASVSERMRSRVRPSINRRRRSDCSWVRWSAGGKLGPPSR